MGICEIQHPAKRFRTQDVVGVAEEYVRRMACLYPDVSRLPRPAAIRLMNHAEVGVPGSMFIEDQPAGVCRSVINRDYLVQPFIQILD
jgi:hypothetical protein